MNMSYVLALKKTTTRLAISLTLATEFNQVVKLQSKWEKKKNMGSSFN